MAKMDTGVREKQMSEGLARVRQSQSSLVSRGLSHQCSGSQGHIWKCSGTSPASRRPRVLQTTRATPESLGDPQRYTWLFLGASRGRPNNVEGPLWFLEWYQDGHIQARTLSPVLSPQPLTPLSLESSRSPPGRNYASRAQAPSQMEESPNPKGFSPAAGKVESFIESSEFTAQSPLGG